MNIKKYIRAQSGADFSARSKTKMGKKVQCCIRVKRASHSSCSSSSSSSELCPTAVSGTVLTTAIVNDGVPTYIQNSVGAVKKLTTGFSITGVNVPLYYATPQSCDGGLAVGEVQYGILYIATQNPAGSSSAYSVNATIVAEGTGAVPQTFELKLQRHQVLLYVPNGAGVAAGSAVFTYTYYPHCLPTPVCALASPSYM